MSMNKQTAVEWLVKELNLEGYDYTISQAKQMHKEQTLEFIYSAVRKILDEDRQNPFNLEQSYDEEYGNSLK